MEEKSIFFDELSTTKYYYDALGRRMRKVVSDKENSSDSFERRYVYDGQEILAEYDSNSVIGVYTHSTLRTDDVLAVDVKSSKLASSTGSYFYLKDALGSVVDIVDGSGNLVQHYSYSSFGKILKIVDGSGNDITNSSVVKTSYGFTNREHDVESGMMYYRARYMMPEIGRFIQEDPHPGIDEKPRTFTSKYIYAVNNPNSWVDPSGEFIFTAMAIGAVIGGAMAASSGGNILEGALIGAVAGAAGGYMGYYAGLAAGGGLAGGIAGFVVGAVTGAFTGGVTGGLINVAKGGGFEDGFHKGAKVGMVAGGAAGTYTGYNAWNIALEKATAKTALNLGRCSAIVGGAIVAAKVAAVAVTAYTVAGTLAWHTVNITAGSALGAGVAETVSTHCLSSGFSLW
ncbi:MAG: RHS repeat-associated core domain-containing protein [Bacteriovoracaceae bacterium]|jgi:RHS repeat-associated protein|nr:RHS repeat-associated core domain-containing protein [Bacteriovoracaceae bacterium]